MAPIDLENIILLITILPGLSIEQNLPSGNLLFWSIADGQQSQVRWLPANPESYRDNKTITATARYAGNYRWNAIAVDYQERNAILSDSFSNSIYNAHEWFHSEGKAEQTVFGTSGYHVHAIAIDWFSRAFYWVDDGFNWIRLSTYDSINTATIIDTGLEQPMGIAVYPAKGYLFWTDIGQKIIGRASLSGKNRTTIVYNLRKPTDITIDATNVDGRIYWIDESITNGENHTIESSNLDGQDRRTEYNLPFLDGTLLDIAVGKEFIFVAIEIPNLGSVIRYLSKDSKTAIHELSLENEVLDIAVSGYELQPWDPNYGGVCFNADPKCNDFCVHDGIGGYECLCSDKYSLHADGVNCTFDSSVIEPPYFIFTRQNEISFIPVTLVHQGQEVSEGIDRIHTLLKDSESPLALAIDFQDQLLFYSDRIEKSVKVVTIAEEELPRVVYQRIGQVEGLAVDWLAKNIYWTDYKFNHIVVCTYDSLSMRELFNIDVIKPRSIAIDPFAKLMFWSELGPPGQIESSNLDGSNRRVINDITDQPSGLAVDLSKQRVYFADRNDGSIHYMNYDGSKLNTFYTHPGNSFLNFFDITLYQDFIFWTESTLDDRNGIYVASNENGEGILGNLPDSSTVYSIETYDRSVQPSGGSVCNQEGNNGCSRLCLTSSLNETSCACSDGFVIDDNDYTQCKPESSILQDDFYLIADQEKHSIFQMNAKEPFNYIGLNIGIVGDPVDITYDPIERRLYWVDAEIPAIRRSSLDSTNVESVIKDKQIIVSPMGVAVDYVLRLMFWTDSVLGKIEVSYLDGTVRHPLINTENEPRDIVVDPIGRRIFWSEHGNNPEIKSAYMDGGSERSLTIPGSVSKPSGLVINFKEGKLYWCDEANGVIESINLDGTGSQMYIELPSPSQPKSATLRLDDVVWSDNMETSLRHVDSESGEAISIDDNHFGKMSSIHHHASISSLEVTDVGNNECLDENGGCSHICLPGQVVGDVTCTCDDGVVLSSNNKQCLTEVLCPKTFLGGGVDDSCTRYVNSSCEIYCIPQFIKSNLTINVTCNEFGYWNEDTSLLCIRVPDPIWVTTMAPETTPKSSSPKGFLDVYKMWITFGAVASLCLIIMFIIVIIRGSKDIAGPTVGFANRPLPEPKPDPYYYEDAEYDTIKNLTYDTHISSSEDNSRYADQKLANLEESGYLIGDNSTTNTLATDVPVVTKSADNPAFVYDYATKVNNKNPDHCQFGIRDEFGYLIVENATTNALATDVVDDYATKVNNEGQDHDQLGTRDKFGYLIIDNSTTNTLDSDLLTNSADNPAFVDDYTTKITSNEDVVNSADDNPTMVNDQYPDEDGLNSGKVMETVTSDGDIMNCADNPVIVED